MSGIFPSTAEYQWVWWIIGYVIFLGLNLLGVELSFKVSVIVTLLALAVLAIYWISAIPHFDFNRWALNIGVDPATGTTVELPEGNGSFMPLGWAGVLAALPFAVWLFLAIEQLPLAAEESHDPKRDMPKGLLSGFVTLAISATLIMFLNAEIGVQNADGTAHGAFYLGGSAEPLLDGFRVTIPELAEFLAICALVGLIASFHTIIYAMGRQVYSLSRAGYFPRGLSVTHGKHQVPHQALVIGAIVGFVVMIVIYFVREDSGAIIGGTLLNMAVFGAMICTSCKASPSWSCARGCPISHGRMSVPWARLAATSSWPSRQSRCSCNCRIRSTATASTSRLPGMRSASSISP